MHWDAAFSLTRRVGSVRARLVHLYCGARAFRLRDARLEDHRPAHGGSQHVRGSEREYGMDVAELGGLRALGSEARADR